MRIRFLLSGLLFLSLFQIGVSATIHVPGDHPTIQGAIDAAVNGDTVLVAPGTYVENINFGGKAITVTSTDGAAFTIIDGSNPVNPDFGSVVAFHNNEGTDSVLKGFTLTMGTGTLCNFDKARSGYLGGGILCNGSSPTIEKNTILSNTADRYGGGIGCINDSNAIIKNNLIKSNAADNSTTYNYGGGIFCLESSPLITQNTIEDNYTDPVGYGAGIYCFNSSSTISHNDISQNSAGTYGGGIYCSESTPIICNNYIHRNFSSSGGGICINHSDSTIINNIVHDNYVYNDGDNPLDGAGMYIYSSSAIIMNNIFSDNWGDMYGHGGGISFFNMTSTITNNIFFGNQTYEGGGIALNKSTITLTNNTIVGNEAQEMGGGIYCIDSSITITNSILWDNETLWKNKDNDGPEIGLESPYDPSTLTISHSNVKGGQYSVYAEPGCMVEWGSGMIDSDPLFIDAENNDYHLTYNSPCRNTGDNGTVADLIDYEGDPRIAWGDVVDMGADEFYTHFYCTGNFLPSGTIVAKLVGLPGTTPTGIFLGSSELDPPLTTAWGEFFIAPPWFLISPLGAIPSDGFIAISTVVPASSLPPYDVYLQGLVGLSAEGLTNLFVAEVR